jgi:phospholipid/cholesterol/gamma-HCH transport system substrate-binding protein
MTARVAMRRVLAIGCCVALTGTGCAFHGLNSLPLPGAVGRGPGSDIYHVELANVVTMESNSPVMIDDVVVGSVGAMKVKDWHADVEFSVKRDLVIPANVVASIGQTSLLGSMHLELNPPLGQPGVGRLRPGATIPLSRSSAYPSSKPCRRCRSSSTVGDSGRSGISSTISAPH